MERLKTYGANKRNKMKHINIFKLTYVVLVYGDLYNLFKNSKKNRAAYKGYSSLLNQTFIIKVNNFKKYFTTYVNETYIELIKPLTNIKNKCLITR